MEREYINCDRCGDETIYKSNDFREETCVHYENGILCPRCARIKGFVVAEKKSRIDYLLEQKKLIKELL